MLPGPFDQDQGYLDQPYSSFSRSSYRLDLVGFGVQVQQLVVEFET